MKNNILTNDSPKSRLIMPNFVKKFWKKTDECLVGKDMVTFKILFQTLSKSSFYATYTLINFEKSNGNPRDYYFPFFHDFHINFHLNSLPPKNKSILKVYFISLC